MLYLIEPEYVPRCAVVPTGRRKVSFIVVYANEPVEVDEPLMFPLAVI